jgi:hypothetical protein
LEALALAKRNGRPLLVLVVPSDIGLRAIRGRVIGVYLNRVDDEGLADLVTCGLWCATPAEIASDFPSAKGVDDSTLAVLIETDGSGVVTVPGDESLQDVEHGRGAEPEKATEEAKANTELLRTKLHAAIAPNEVIVRRRSDQARTKFLQRASRYDLGAMNDGDVPTDAHVKRVPAWVRWRAETADPKTRAKWIAMLAAEAAERWRSAPPPRTHWGKSSGCGIEYEDKWITWTSVSCGMGCIPEYASRFLSFFTEYD